MVFGKIRVAREDPNRVSLEKQKNEYINGDSASKHFRVLKQVEFKTFKHYLILYYML